jgi:lipopolysaccharide transport system ATP-binding protein
MSKPAIEINNLSKRYRISHLEKNQIQYQQSIKEDLIRVFKKPLQLIGSQHGTHKEEFWALNDVSFKIERGEALGVVGRNGSGKSTLFKILSKITQPTKGNVIIRGKVSSLLEVGSGFHVELTGRENVFFNGAILGMRKAEISKKFDEIVSFAEIEKFIDTPVKFYSSGMRSRLGFSVAAHLDPDIFLVDEVLAVGDADFKIKCIEKMRQIANQGKTVLFVSHIMAHIKKLCDKGILLQDGKISMVGNIEDIAKKYLECTGLDSAIADEDSDLFPEQLKSSSLPLHKRSDFKGTGEVKFLSLTANCKILEDRPSLRIETIIFNNTYLEIKDIQLAVVIRDGKNQEVTTLSTALMDKPFILDVKEKAKISFFCNNLPIPPGAYKTKLIATSNSRPQKMYSSMTNTGTFMVPEYEFYKKPLIDVTSQVGPILVDFDYSKDETETR